MRNEEEGLTSGAETVKVFQLMALLDGVRGSAEVRVTANDFGSTVQVIDVVPPEEGEIDPTVQIVIEDYFLKEDE